MPRAGRTRSAGSRRGGGPPGGINHQGKLFYSGRGTSRGRTAGINWNLHGKASGFYQCLALARHVPARMRRGYCSNRGLEATGRRPGSGTRRGGRR